MPAKAMAINVDIIIFSGAARVGSIETESKIVISKPAMNMLVVSLLSMANGMKALDLASVVGLHNMFVTTVDAKVEGEGNVSAIASFVYDNATCATIELEDYAMCKIPITNSGME